MEEIIELEKTRDLQPYNMWSYSEWKKWIMLYRFSKTYAKKYNGLRKKLIKMFYDDKELYPTIMKLPHMYLLTNSRFEIIFLSIIITLFSIVIFFKIETGVLHYTRFFGGGFGYIDIIYILFPVFFIPLYIFIFYKLAKKKRNLETIMSEIKRIIQERG